MNYNDILAKLPPLAESYQNMGIPQALDTREQVQVVNPPYQLGKIDRYSRVASPMLMRSAEQQKADALKLQKIPQQQAALQAGYDAKLAQLTSRFADKNPDKLDRKVGKLDAKTEAKSGKLDQQLAAIQSAPYYQTLLDLVNRYPGRVTEPTTALAKGGAVDGPGTGTSDSVPAMIDGAEPAALSDGEFVFTHQAVLGFGQGDEQAGHENLMRLMKMAEEVGRRYTNGDS